MLFFGPIFSAELGKLGPRTVAIILH